MNKKAWYKSRTVWLGVGTIAIGVLAYLETVALPDWAYVLIGCLTVALRLATTTGVSIKATAAKTTLGSLIIIGLIAGCGTLTVKAKKTADCKLVAGPPHSVICTVDDTVRYTQRGEMKLDIKATGACPCPN